MITSGGPSINEIHYDNAGGDTGEFIELKAPTAGFDFTGYEIVLYNGSNGTVYDTETIDAATAGGACDIGGCTYLSIPIAGIQNGAPDGVALVNAGGAVCEFISYEGALTATAGPANGMTSVDIGVAETSSTPIGSSLQKQPDGSWSLEANDTPKAVNECFVTGTSILTENGYKKVENLKIGDLVVTADNKQQKIKWIGYQTITPKEISIHKKDTPVLFKRNSLGANIPINDLLVSPDHAILIDGLLINAGALVNDFDILCSQPTEKFKYFHIELDCHSLLIAEGVEAESYLPQKEVRSHYDNGSEYQKEDEKIVLWPMDYPRISASYKVPNHVFDKINQHKRNKKKLTA